MTRDQLLAQLAGLRRARVAGQRAPHKPLLVLWLLGRFATDGSTEVSYADAEEPVSALINDFGPAVRSPSQAGQRAALPFVHLERSLWELRDAQGRPLDSHTPGRGTVLRAHGARGRLRPEVERALAEPGTLAAAVTLLLETHFTPALEELIVEAVGLDLTELEVAAARLVTVGGVRRARNAGFADVVLRAYGYACAMCGFDGTLGRRPVGIEAAHIRWHSQRGPDLLTNGLALCALHHTLFDLGALGLTVEGRVRVSGLYAARSAAGRATRQLDGRPLAEPAPGQPGPGRAFVAWHSAEVFKSAERDGEPVA
ncbi:phosphorothioated DNA-binding restriction endonuclease [Streptomyces profundus]|uniref:phosphorothioated DNA-binding restriction endonuclease n=1 Tax=Streptomyces profundus TaxID=2867410 RepID=UPI001D16A29F|nr:HNH endonuclease [Streptomyces sp. MA3_2.13]UED85529.1 HNH endonuclease [Streptomyces sp. MA3_2.13]